MKVRVCVGLAGVLAVSLVATPGQTSAAASVSTVSYRGVSIVPSSRTDLENSSFRASVRQAQLDGANTIDIVVQYEQPSRASSTIRATSTTPTTAALRSAMNYVRQRKMRVAFKVFFDTTELTSKKSTWWRYYLNPKNRKAWFKHATSIEVALGRLHPDLFILGTEMGTLSSQAAHSTNGAYWRALIKAVRKVDPHKLTYEAQTPNATRSHGEAGAIAFWPQLDYMSFSGYNSLDLPCSTTADTIARQWKKIDKSSYAPLQRRYHKQIIFGEIGYSSFPCDHAAPYAYHGPKAAVDNQEQANDYAGFLKYWLKRADVAGILIWNWVPSPKPSSFYVADFTPQNKPAELAIRTFLASGQTTEQIWWPTSTFPYTHAVSQPQPFQAVLTNVPLDEYVMSWSVLGGGQTVMPDGVASDGTPEKRIDVDLSSWNWNSDNQYEITFTATTLGGARISSSHVLITIEN